jgi:MFS family permease
LVSTQSKQDRFYGWTALIGVMLIFFCQSADIFCAYSVFLPPMCKELGFSRSAMSAPYTVFMLIGGMLGPLIGISASRFGARKNIIIGNLIAVLGLSAMFLVKQIWQVYLFFSVMVGIGIAFGAFIPATVVVNNWFVRRRPLAMSLVFIAGGTGGFIFPPVISWFISNWGWQLAWVCLACIHLIGVVVTAGILIRNNPEQMGQIPDGTAREENDANSLDILNRKRTKPQFDWELSDALRTRALWLTLFFSVSAFFTMNILNLHLVAYIEDLGFSPLTASTVLSMMVGAGIIGTLLCGILSSRIQERYLGAICLAGFAAGMIILMSFKVLPIIYLAAILNGVSTGGIGLLMTMIISSYYGSMNYARIMGWTSPITSLLGPISPLIAGFIYDATGSYIIAFSIGVGFLAIGIVCALLARQPIPL